MSAHRDFARTAGLVGLMAVGLSIGQAGWTKEAPVVVYGDPSATRTERVSYAGLDLANARDARKLHLRVAGAVKRVCLFDNNRAKLQASDYYPCADGAWRDAREQIANLTSSNTLAANGTAAIKVVAFGG